MMGAVRTKTLADLRRRKLQAIVIALVVFLSSSAATLALATLVESQAPFDHAFAAANGADLAIDYAGTVSPAALAGTAHAAPVTGSTGPWPVAMVGFLNPDASAKGGGQVFEAGGISGRSDPATVVDRVTISAGRWWNAPGELVLGQLQAEAWGVKVGDRLTLEQAPDFGKNSGPPPPGSQPGPIPGPAGGDLATRTLTVVGIAGSISESSANGWLSPADIAALTPGQVLAQEMLYRVSPAATAADLAAAQTAITAGLPSTAVLASQTFLEHKADVDRTASIFVPILLAFSIFALLAASFTIANVVAGIVLGGYREIGVMKAIGFTPTQVVAILLGQILVPVLLGAAAGVTLGTVASQPILAQTARAFGLPAAFTLSLPVVAAVLTVAGLTAVLAAVGPATRAGRLGAVAAITQGTAPSTESDGNVARRVALGLPLPTPVRIGFASGVAHALRAAMTFGALVVGVAALVFALGLDRSLQEVAADLIRDRASPIRLQVQDPADAPASVTAALAANPGTDRFVVIGQADVSVPGIGGSAPYIAYQGDSSWIGYAIIAGRWFGAPGEAVAPTNFFTQTGLHVGDTVTIAQAGHPLRIRLVGEIFDQASESQDDLVLRGEWTDLASVDPTLQPIGWEVLPKPAADPQTYAASLQEAVGQSVSVEVVRDSSTTASFLLYEGVISVLGAVLIAISLGGVFNTVLLETRQRTRQTAILKTLGMTPTQVVVMVVASVAPVGVLAGLAGVPLGVVFQRAVLGFMGQAASKTAIPGSALDVFAPPAFVVLGLAGLAIAAMGAYLPAQRAARARIAAVLQTE